MNSTFSALLLLLMIYGCSNSTSQPVNNKTTTANASDTIKTYTAENLQGSWKCINSTYYFSPMLAAETDWINQYTPGTVVFSNDSVWQFDVPFQMVSASTIQNENHWLNGYMIGTDTINLLEVEDDGAKWYRSYARHSVDMSIIDTLKQLHLNTRFLQKKWHLVDEINTSYDGHGIVAFEIPFKIDTLLDFTTSEIDKVRTGKNIFTLNVDGVPREFEVRFYQDTYDNMIHLKPLNWDANICCGGIYYSPNPSAAFDIYN